MARFRAMGRWPFVRYLAVVGAASGLLAWLVAYAAHFVFGVDKPSVLALVLAIPRGALYGVIMALILSAYWTRRAASWNDESGDRR